VRPRVWWKDAEGRSLFLNAGAVDEDRTGGTLTNRQLPNGAAFPEDLHTRRFDVGAVSHLSFDDGDALNGRVSVTSSHLDRTFDTQRIASSQVTVFGEEAMNGVNRGHNWVLGAAFVRDQLAVGAVPGVSYSYNVPALFAQDTFAVAKWMVVAGSMRVDANSDYGTFVSPRVSALLRRPDGPWSLRASVGGGYSPPTPFLEEIEDTGLGTLLPLRGLHAERAVSESVDARWTDAGWDINMSVFNSEIRSPLEVLPSGNQLQLINARGPRRAPGAEVLIGYVAGPIHALGSWSAIDATQVDPGGLRRDVSLVPRQTGSLDAILEFERRGRVGLELDYTGRQGLDYDPYRTMSRAYFSFNALAEVRFKGVAVFVNAINLSNVRQTRWDPLLRPSPGPGGNPITDVWAPLDGRILNLGIRAEL
jgi:outer membrane receptor for ferrienterochelin and colicins